jgi:Domain of unknown function (DUF4202)
MLERLIIDPDTRPRRARPPEPSSSNHPDGPGGFTRLLLEFPTVDVAFEPPAGSVIVEAAGCLRADFDLEALDERAARAEVAGAWSLRIAGASGDAARAALGLLTRYQRFVRRRNPASEGEPFDTVLARHRALHDLDKPLVRADHEHAIDTWHWTLRLDPAAGLAVQIAALFHDVERLASEADVRVEHRARDYQAFKDAHAKRGAEMTRDALAGAGIPSADVDAAARLVEGHERSGEGDAALLADADALSFFSLNSGGFLRHYGVEHTRKKIAYSRARLRPETRPRMRQIRYLPAVEALVDLGGEPSPAG